MKSDNHVDELGAKLQTKLAQLASNAYLMGFSHCQGVSVNGENWNSANPEKVYVDETLEATKRQIEDFYRNKIPEKKYTPLDIGNKHPNKRAELMEFIIGYNQAIDNVITAQFNSKGDNDE